jgi:predicted peroxiredoxin
MPTLLITSTHGTDDPTRATMPFHFAKGAKEAGFDVAIVLANDSPVILKDAVRESILGVGTPPLRELFQFAVENQVRVYV